MEKVFKKYKDFYISNYGDVIGKRGNVLKNIKKKDGYLLCQPNNRIFWKDSNFITNEFPVDPKEFKVDTTLQCVEAESDRWVSSNGDSFYYDINEVEK